MMELLIDFNQTRGRGVVWTVVGEGDVMLGQQVIVTDPDEELSFYGVVIKTSPAKAVGRMKVEVRVGPEWISVV